MDIRRVRLRRIPEFAALWLGDPENWERYKSTPIGERTVQMGSQVSIDMNGYPQLVSAEHLFWILPLRPDADRVITSEMKSEDLFTTIDVLPVHADEYKKYLNFGQILPPVSAPRVTFPASQSGLLSDADSEEFIQ